MNICAICQLDLVDPRTFTSHNLIKAWYPEKNVYDCRHNFCYKCMEEWLKTCLINGNSFTCPQCRFEAIDYDRLLHWYLLYRCFLEWPRPK